jgi:triphosphoribosyl-dephospho-CoA synthetase
MAEKITYYAILDEFSTFEKPGGVLRRVENDEGKTDEIFSRDLAWEFSSLLIAAERGDTMFEFVQVSKAEAGRIIASIRELAASGE